MKTTQTKHVHPLSPFGGRGALSPFGGRGAILLLLWGLGGLFGGFSAWAQTTVTLLGEDFATNEVTFSVTMSPATSTWVFVEYTTNPHNPADMSRATFTSATFNPPAAGTFSASGTSTAEGQGFWLTNSATVTAKLKDVSGMFSWCAYAINVPPNAEVKANGGYTLRGTPPFLINGSIPVNGYDFGPGTCISSITDLTYNPAGFLRTPPMTVTASAPATVCAGAPLTFAATATGGTTTAMSYTWRIAGAGTTTTTTNPYITALATTGADAYTPYTYTVYATNANGCTSTVSPAGTVTVYAVPVLEDVSSATICSGLTAALSATASNVTDPATYTWNIQGQSQTATTTSTYTTPPLPATATYTVQITNATGCTSAVSNAGTLTVYAVPLVNKVSSASICAGATAALSATVSNVTTPATYTWNIQGQSQTATTTSTYTTPPLPATATYTVQITNATGCKSAVSGAGTITVYNALVPGTITSSTTTICKGGTVSAFTATAPSGGNGNYTYQWKQGTGNATGTSTASSFTPSGTYLSTPGTYRFTRVVTSCTSGTTTGTYTLVVLDDPTVTMVSAESLCSGTQPAAMTATPSGGTGTITYQWYSGASAAAATNLISGATATTYQPGPISTTTWYSVVVSYDGSGCNAATAMAVNKTVYDVPAAPTNASSNTRCGSGTVTFSATVPGGITIDWYDAVSGDTPVASGTTYCSPDVMASATYYAQAKNTTTGCISTSRLAVTATVNAVPATPTGASSNTRCGSGTVTFSATVPGGTTIDWYDAVSGGFSVSSGTTSYSPNLTASATYYAQAKNNTTGCVSAGRLPVTATVDDPIPGSVGEAATCAKFDAGQIGS